MNDIFSDFTSETLKEIIESSPAGIYVNDLKGTLLYGNKKAERIVGYKREELIGKNIAKIVLLDAAGVAKALKLLAMNKLGKETGPDEFELRRKDGTKSIVIIRTNPIEIDNRKLVIGMVEDITERKKLETELKERNEELERVQNLTVGRELKMIQLKKEIEQLKEKVKTLENK
jgi:PAS domain S-box-containing protein